MKHEITSAMSKQRFNGLPTSVLIASRDRLREIQSRYKETDFLYKITHADLAWVDTELQNRSAA